MLRFVLCATATLTAVATVSAHDFAPPGARQMARFWSLGFGQGYHSLPVEPHLRRHYVWVQQRQYAPVVLPAPYPITPFAPDPMTAYAGLPAEDSVNGVFWSEEAVFAAAATMRAERASGVVAGQQLLRDLEGHLYPASPPAPSELGDLGR